MELTQAQIAELIGKSRSWVGKLVKVERLVPNDRGKIDTTAPVNADFLRSRGIDPVSLAPTADSIPSGPAGPLVAPGEELAFADDRLWKTTPSEAVLRREKIRRQIAKLAIEEKIKSGDYVRRTAMTRVFGHIGAIIQGQIRPLGMRVAPELAAVAGITDPSIEIEMIKKIDGAVATIIANIQHEFVDWVRAGGASDEGGTTHD